ncbi:MAG TPA: tetratricopeptide repeat protein [Opitutaceae bacterium]|nr:tetratricopeptide repeat protein [Opitutaceae bacterium]
MSLLARPWFAGLALALAVVAAYADSLQGAFVWDDIPSIVENPLIERFGSALRRPAAVNTTSGRPLLALSLAANYALGGRSRAGFHLGNLLIHLAAALCLFGLARRLFLLPGWGGSSPPAAAGLALGVAALWALHPLQTQAVTYVIQRAESLMGLCYLLTLYLALRAETSPAPARWRILAVAACAAGMAAKEVMVSAPVMVLLLDRTFFTGSFRRALAAKPRFYGALFGTWAILAWLVLSLGGDRGGSTGGLSAHAAWLPYWLTQFPAVATYLKLAFFPHPLVFQYGAFWLPAASAAIPSALLVLPLLALTAIALFRWPAAGFCGAWFFSVLAVTSLVPGTADMIAEHRMYVALAPLCILAVAGLHRALGSAALGPICAAALALGALTVARNRDYRSGLALWSDNVAKRPGNALARYNLAVALLREPGRGAEAQAQLEAAVGLQPSLGMAHYNLALLLAQRPGQADRAIAEYRRAIQIAPGYSQAHNNLGVLLQRRGRADEARRQFELAVQCDRGNRSAWSNLVRTLAAEGRADEALAAAAALVRAHPDSAEGQAQLGILLAGRGDPAGSVPHLEAALRADSGPWAEGAHFSLGTAYAAAGRISDAAAQFAAAVRLDPGSANAQFNLAAALELAGGHRAEAIAHYRAAAALEPGVAESHFRLARLLAADPKARGEARSELGKVLALNPEFPGARGLSSELGLPPP